MPVKVSADSICDLTPEQIERYAIDILPISIVKDNVTYKDGVEITQKEIFDYMDSGAGVCHTIAINIVEYSEFFSRFADKYDAVIHFTLSSKMSSCYQNALIAASEFKNVYVIDSKNLSTGAGHLVLDAAIMAQEGRGAQEIIERINGLVDKVEASFVIDSLKYLHKGGRCSGVAALGANVLKLKPCIEVRDGAMTVGKKYRGNYEKVLLEYVRDRLEGRDDIDTRRIFITHPPHGVTPELVQAIREEIQKYKNFDEIVESLASCTISTHCGPMTLGILFYRK